MTFFNNIDKMDDNSFMSMLRTERHIRSNVRVAVDDVRKFGGFQRKLAEVKIVKNIGKPMSFS